MGPWLCWCGYPLQVHPAPSIAFVQLRTQPRKTSQHTNRAQAVNRHGQLLTCSQTGVPCQHDLDAVEVGCLAKATTQNTTTIVRKKHTVSPTILMTRNFPSLPYHEKPFSWATPNLKLKSLKQLPADWWRLSLFKHGKLYSFVGPMGRVSSKMASAQRSKAHQDENSTEYVRVVDFHSCVLSFSKLVMLNLIYLKHNQNTEHLKKLPLAQWYLYVPCGSRVHKRGCLP